MGKRWVVSTGALALVVAACTAGSDSATTTESPTTTLDITTTTRPQIVNGGLVQVDPATLVPEPGAEPILAADSFWGRVSPNRRFVGIVSWQSADESNRLSIIDLDNYTVVNSTETEQGAFDLTVTDDGTAYWVRGGNELQLMRLALKADTPEIIFDDVPMEGFYSDGFEILGPTTFGFFGATSIDGTSKGEASVLIVDTSDGLKTQIPLPEVDQGFIEEGEVINEVPTLVIANPSVVWDLDNHRVLIVEAARDVITEVSLTEGDVAEHRWKTPEAFLDGLFAQLIPAAQAKGPTAGITRDAELSADGRRLYIATAVGTIEEEKEVSSPLDLIVLDTETWDATAIDANVDRLYPSPDGVFLLAQGAEVREGELGVRASPVYVIDMASAELLIGFQTSDVSATDVSFSRDGSLAYITTWSDQDMKIDILDLRILQLSGAVEFPELSLIGEAGLMAFHLD